MKKPLFGTWLRALSQTKINERKSLDRVEKSIEHLRKKFANLKAVQTTTPFINDYILFRLEDGASNASINQELAALKKMFYLDAKQTPPVIDRVPHIPMLKERNTRTGFFEH